MKTPTAALACFCIAVQAALAAEPGPGRAGEDAETEEFEYSVGRGSGFRADPEEDPTVRGRMRAFIGAFEASWRSTGLRPRSLRGEDSDGLAIPGVGTSDPGLGQSWSAKSEALHFARAEVTAQRCGFHMRAGVFAGAAHQTIVQKIGPGSFFLQSGDKAEESSAVTDWGFGFGGRFEIAHFNPLALLTLFGVFKDLASGSGKKRKPGGADAFGLRLGVIGAAVAGVEAGFSYMRLPIGMQGMLARTVGGSWRTTAWNVGIFAGLHIGDTAILKAGVEYVTEGVRAYVNTRGASAESWRIRATNYSTGFFCEVMLILFESVMIDLRAGSAGHGYASAGLSVALS